jgi:hypothetical protein
MSNETDLTPAERRRALMSARAIWLRDLAADPTLPFTRLERIVLRAAADKVRLVAGEGGTRCE